MPPTTSAKPLRSKVRLEVKTTSGSFEDEFPVHEKVELLLREAERRLHLATGPGIEYRIIRQRGNLTMNPDERLSAYELVDGDVILIQAVQAQDG